MNDNSIATQSSTSILLYNEPLTPAEIKVMRVLLNPFCTTEDAAGQLSISQRTVHRHLESVYSKLGESTRPAAVCRFVTVYREYLSEMLPYYLPTKSVQDLALLAN